MTILCPSCNAALPAWFLTGPRVENLCPSCYRSVRLLLFPAIENAAQPKEYVPATLREATESACFEHPTKRAVNVCESCGRFVCGLCETEIDGRISCPGCVGGEVLREQQNRRRTLYDSIALALAIWPVFLMFYVGLLAAPITLYVVIRHWRKPGSLIPRNKWRFVVAGILAVAELATLGALIFIIVFYANRSRA